MRFSIPKDCCELMTEMFVTREITTLRLESLGILRINGQTSPTNETAVRRYFHKNDMILLKVVNNILDETRFSFR